MTLVQLHLETNLWSKAIQKEMKVPAKTSKIGSKENQSNIPPEMLQDRIEGKPIKHPSRNVARSSYEIKAPFQTTIECTNKLNEDINVKKRDRFCISKAIEITQSHLRRKRRLLSGPKSVILYPRPLRFCSYPRNLTIQNSVQIGRGGNKDGNRKGAGRV
jgi:hypothetical protein